MWCSKNVIFSPHLFLPIFLSLKMIMCSWQWWISFSVQVTHFFFLLEVRNTMYRGGWKMRCMCTWMKKGGWIRSNMSTQRGKEEKKTNLEWRRDSHWVNMKPWLWVIVFHVSDRVETMLLKPLGIRVTLCGCYSENSTNASSDAELHWSQRKYACAYLFLYAQVKDLYIEKRGVG